MKQNEIDLHSKIDDLIRQKNELTCAIDNISKQNKQFSDTLEVTQRNLQESNRDCDNLKINLTVTEDKISKLNNDIEDQTVLNNTIKEAKEKETNDIKQFLDDTKAKQNETIHFRESEHQETLHAYENNKTEMINQHNKMKQDLDAHIAKINKDKLDLQRQFDDMKVKLSEERDALLSELDKRKEAHDMIVNETINKIDVNKKEIE